MSLLRRRAMMDGSDIALPNGYRKVNYLECTGTQYIDTGFVPDVNSAMYCKMAITDDGSNGRNNTSGCVLSANQGWFCVGGYGNSVGIAALFAVNSRAGAIISYDNDFHDFYITNGIQKIDDVVENNEIDSFLADMLSVYLFKVHVNYASTLTPAQKISSCKLWQSGVLEHDFIPCLRMQDNKPGMYDVVTRAFFTNDGTGEFLYG